MIINGAWNIDALPNVYIIEKPDGALAKFYIAPFRELTDRDLQPYKGYHPRKCKGSPMPDYLYGLYGLAKNDETLSEILHLRLTPSDIKRLAAAAAKSGVNKSEFLRTYIASLPDDQ